MVAWKRSATACTGHAARRTRFATPAGYLRALGRNDSTPLELAKTESTPAHRIRKSVITETKLTIALSNPPHSSVTFAARRRRSLLVISYVIATKNGENGKEAQWNPEMQGQHIAEP